MSMSIHTAISRGDLDEVKLVLEKSPYHFSYCCEQAAGYGYLHILQWLRAQSPPWLWSTWTCRNAAMNGHLHILQWLRAQVPPCPWDEYVCTRAASGGHLHILQWLRAQDPPCPWDEETCSRAAAYGNLYILQWLRAQDPPCPWDDHTCEYAARNNHFRVLKWLRAQSPPCPLDKADLVLFMWQNTSYRVFHWLAKYEKVEFGPLALQWMAEVDEAVAQVSTSSDIQSLVKEFVEM